MEKQTYTHVHVATLPQTSVGRYQGQKMPDGGGFKNVRFMDGSIAAWPYEISGKKPSSDQEVT